MEWTHIPSAAPVWTRPRGFIRWIVLLGAGCAVVYAMRPVAPPVVTPTRKAATTSVAYGGVIYSGGAVGVGSTLAGTLASIAVHPGQSVRQGDLLFALDAGPVRDEIRAREEEIRELERHGRALSTADAAPEFQEARREMVRAARRWAALSRQGIASDAELWDYQYALDRYREARRDLRKQQSTTHAAIRQARRELALYYARSLQLQRRSPVAGLVTVIQARPGDAAVLGKPILRIEDPRRTTIRVLVGEKDRAHVRPGQRAWIQVTEPTSGKRDATRATAKRAGFPGTVVRVTPGVDGELWQSWVTIRPIRAPTPFLDGQHVTARIVTGRYADAVVVPRGAVRDWRTGAVVYVVHGGRIEERSVKAVATDQGEMAILSGLKPFETVLLHPRADNIGWQARNRGRSAFLTGHPPRDGRKGETADAGSIGRTAG